MGQSLSLRLSQINIYPIKSCGGITVDCWQLEARGLRYDRQWMLVDDEGVFLTQRELPRMALIAVQVNIDSLRVGAPGMEPVLIPFQASSPDDIPVTIWGDGVAAVSVGDEIAEWFSGFLGVSCRLVTMTERSVRRVEGKHAVRDDLVSFADAFPLLLISEESLADLNARLATPVAMRRFRPNLVVQGCEAFAEDAWTTIVIGGITLHVVKPCARCVITTVDPDTGIRGTEPLRTLATYRTVSNNVLFGQNLLHASTGLLRVGDSVHVMV